MLDVKCKRPITGNLVMGRLIVLIGLYYIEYCVQCLAGQILFN